MAPDDEAIARQLARSLEVLRATEQEIADGNATIAFLHKEAPAGGDRILPGIRKSA